jgi:hypothetical protein
MFTEALSVVLYLHDRVIGDNALQRNPSSLRPGLHQINEVVRPIDLAAR